MVFSHHLQRSLSGMLGPSIVHVYTCHGKCWLPWQQWVLFGNDGLSHRTASSMATTVGLITIDTASYYDNWYVCHGIILYLTANGNNTTSYSQLLWQHWLPSRELVSINNDVFTHVIVLRATIESGRQNSGCTRKSYCDECSQRSGTRGLFCRPGDVRCKTSTCSTRWQ